MARKKDQEFLPVVQHARIEKLVIYEISGAELDLLERGSPDSVLLNLAIFFSSISLSFLVALLSTEIPSDRVFLVFVVLTVATGIAGLTLSILWYRSRQSVSALFRTIRSRLPKEEPKLDTLEANEGGIDPSASSPDATS